MNVEISDDRTLLHQNSSLAWPQDDSEKTARFAFRGKLTVLEALIAGRPKTLSAEELTPRRADIGMMRSAESTFWGALKKVAVRTVS